MINNINKLAYIYRITNLINFKMYIGFTTKPKVRWNRHRNNKDARMPIARAMEKYGRDNFIFDIIYCSNDIIHCLEVMEPYFIEHYDTYKYGYNANLGGGKSNLGLKHTQETKEKQRIASSRNRHTTESKQRISDSNGEKWKVIFPDGTEEIIINLSTFCKLHNLNQPAMSHIARGDWKRHKGFQCEKVE